MTFAYHTEEIGRTSSPTNEHYKLFTIRGRSIVKGDGSDSTTVTLTDAQANVGSQSGNRNEAPLYLDIPSRIRRGARVISAVLHLYMNTSTWTSQSVPTDGSQVVEIWPIRRTVTSSLTGMDFQNYFTASPWDEYGMKFGPGSDSDTARVGAITLAQSDETFLGANTSLGIYLDKTVDLRAELQHVLDFDLPLQLMLKPNWLATDGAGNVGFTNPADASVGPALPHGYLSLRYKNPLETYGALGGALNMLDLKDAVVSDLAEHLFLGTPSKGGAGAIVKFFTRNEITETQPAIIVHSGKAQVSSVDNTLVVGSGRMRYVRVHDTAGSNATPTASWKMTFTAATTYDLTRRLEGETAYVNTGITSPTGISISSDHTVVYSSLNALEFFALAFTGTFTAGDVVTFDTRADLHTVSMPLSSLDDVYMAPHAVGDRATALTTKKRVARYATTCQLYGNDTAVIANSGGSTGVIGNVTDGANTGTHIKVPDSAAFLVNSYATIATFNAHDETGSDATGTWRVEQVQIKTIYAINHATYPGQIGLYETLSTPSDFNSTSIFTTGLWLGQMTAPDQTFLAATASVSLATITTSTPLTATSGNITLLDLDSGNTEVRTISTVVGNVITLTAAPSYAYPINTLVFFATETQTNVPWFLFANPPSTATRGRKQGFLSVTSFSVTAA